MKKLLQSEHVAVGGDFANVFDHEDYIAMINATDEVAVVLRAHLILEEFLNIWASRVTKTDDLFLSTFVPFKTKLCIASNLGLADEYRNFLDKFNDIRNSYSHRRKFTMQQSQLDGLCLKVDAMSATRAILPCKKFQLYISGKTPDGTDKEITYTWETADMKKRIMLVFVLFVLNFVTWMQEEFKKRGISYTIIANPNNTVKPN